MYKAMLPVLGHRHIDAGGINPDDPGVTAKKLKTCQCPGRMPQTSRM